MKKPLIGITLDSEESGDYSKFPWYAIRQNYLDSIYEVGGIPFPLFHNIQSVSELSNKLDGSTMLSYRFLTFASQNLNKLHSKCAFALQRINPYILVL